VPFQLVHHDDVALALRAAVPGKGAPGVYNLAAELGSYAVPLPERPRHDARKTLRATVAAHRCDLEP